MKLQLISNNAFSAVIAEHGINLYVEENQYRALLKRFKATYPLLWAHASNVARWGDIRHEQSGVMFLDYINLRDPGVKLRLAQEAEDARIEAGEKLLAIVEASRLEDDGVYVKPEIEQDETFLVDIQEAA